MWLDRVSNPGPLAIESYALLTGLCSPAYQVEIDLGIYKAGDYNLSPHVQPHCTVIQLALLSVWRTRSTFWRSPRAPDKRGY